MVCNIDTIATQKCHLSYSLHIYSTLTGAKPFSDIAIGASLDPFIQHLKEGNKPPQPTGLSDSM